MIISQGHWKMVLILSPHPPVPPDLVRCLWFFVINTKMWRLRFSVKFGQQMAPLALFSKRMDNFRMSSWHLLMCVHLKLNCFEDCGSLRSLKQVLLHAEAENVTIGFLYNSIAKINFHIHYTNIRMSLELVFYYFKNICMVMT